MFRFFELQTNPPLPPPHPHIGSTPPIVPIQMFSISDSEFVTSDVFTPFSDFIFSNSLDLPPPSGRQRTVTVKLKPGAEEVVGVMFWWSLYALELLGDSEGNRYNSRGGFQDHWPCSLYVLPERRSGIKGGEVEVVCAHNDETVWFELKDRKDDEKGEMGEGGKRTKFNPIERPPVATFSANRTRMLNRYERL